MHEWMCECKRNGFIFPLDTCPFDAKTKSCWTSTWPQLGLIVWYFRLLDKLLCSLFPATRTSTCFESSFRKSALYSPTVTCTNWRSLALVFNHISLRSLNIIKGFRRSWLTLLLRSWLWSVLSRDVSELPRPGSDSPAPAVELRLDLVPMQRIWEEMKAAVYHLLAGCLCLLRIAAEVNRARKYVVFEICCWL